MKQKFLLIIILVSICLTLSGQTGNSDFKEYIKKQREEFERQKRQMRSDFENYRDSVNREYASFLEKSWKVYGLQKEEPPIKTPIAVPPVYDPVAPKPKPVTAPVRKQSQPPRSSPPKQAAPVKPAPVKPAPEEKPVRTPVPPQQQPQPQPPEDKPLQPVVPQYPVKTEFFGTPIALKSFTPPSFRRLTGVSEKDVAAYWNGLSQHPHAEWTNEIRRLVTELNLNDWGMYLLINKLFEVCCPNGTTNEQVVFTVFVLNQLGYRAKTGRNNSELVPLIASQNKIQHTSFFRYGDIRYSAINPQHKDLTAIRACEIDYPDATRSMDMSIKNIPRLSVSLSEKALSGNQSAGKVIYNKNLIDFYSTYPCVEFSVYAEAPFDRASLQSIETQIASGIREMSQEDGVNILLHFVQLAFDYKTDTQQYGYERWLFAEETLASTYSDCDDRAILFAQLVRRILGMKVVLIYYPGIHLATAVHFDNPKTDGDNVIVDNTKYLICDPTYRGANLGAAMPKLKNESVEVIKLF